MFFQFLFLISFSFHNKIFSLLLCLISTFSYFTAGFLTLGLTTGVSLLNHNAQSSFFSFFFFKNKFLGALYKSLWKSSSNLDRRGTRPVGNHNWFHTGVTSCFAWSLAPHPPPWSLYSCPTGLHAGEGPLPITGSQLWPRAVGPEVGPHVV